MNPLEITIATFFATVIASAISLYSTHRKQRQMEAYKASLQTELEQSKLQMQNDLQIKFFEYQTKFSLLHQRQAEVIKDLYGLLAETNENIIRSVSPMFNVTDSTDIKHAETTTAKYNALAEYFVKNRIYFEEGTCNRIDELLLKMRSAMTKARLGQRPQAGARGTELWGEAWDSVTKEIPLILRELETQFRAFFSPQLKTDVRQTLATSEP